MQISDWRNWKAIFSVSEVGPLTFPSPLYSYFSKPLTYFESLTTSELQQQWKKQWWAAVILTYVSPLFTQTKPLCFFWGQKTSPPLQILSSHSGPNLLALHEAVMQLQRADEEA